MTVVISNPPYNIRWNHPIFARNLPEFSLGLPPESNANWTFVLKSFAKADEGLYILPNGAITTSNKDELEVIRNVIKENYLKAVIQLPDKMFESTSIATCVLWLSSKKDTIKIAMVDLSDRFTIVERKQNGQVGETNTKRTYTKKIKVLSDNLISEVVQAIKNRKETDYLKLVSPKTISTNDYKLSPGIYLAEKQSKKHVVNKEQIAKDLNAIISKKNGIKITIGKNVAKNIGFLDVFEKMIESQKISKEIVEALKDTVETKIIKEDKVSLTRYREFKIEIKNFDEIPEAILFFLQAYRQYMYMLNNLENQKLNELKDALLDEFFNQED